MEALRWPERLKLDLLPQGGSSSLKQQESLPPYTGFLATIDLSVPVGRITALIYQKSKCEFIFFFSVFFSPSQTGKIKPVVLPLLWFAEVSCFPRPHCQSLSCGRVELLRHHPLLGKLRFG